MFTKKVLVAALFAAGIIGAGATPLATADVAVQLNVAPPPLRYEVVPAPRRGYVWGPGHWQWNGKSHAWRAGNWVQARPGYAYQSPQWVERGGRWHYQASRWDRDGDGIPNNRDRTPNGAIQRGDRDGDGVPNRRDAAPNNPNRS